MADHYEQRFVVFVDIMGFKYFIESSEENRNLFLVLQQALRSLKSISDERISLDDIDLRSVVFSDSIIISTRVNPLGMYVLIHQLADLWNQLTVWGIYVRGAIVQGNLHHDDSVVFGKGLIEAYELESRMAKYPRILLHPELYRYAQNTRSLRAPDVALYEFFRRDFDGLYFLDVWGWKCQGLVLQEESKWEELLRVGVKLNLCKSISKKTSLDVFSKRAWLVNYFNAVISESPGLNIEPIPIPNGGQSD